MNPVPPDKARWSSFNELEQYNQLALKGILEAARRERRSRLGRAEGRRFLQVGDGYAAVDAAA